MRRIGLMALILSVLVGGCTSRQATLERLRTDDPRVQAETIAKVARDGDKSMAGELIALLESEDEGVRFMAATALHQLTGRHTRFHFAGPEERERIIQEWRQWWDGETDRPAAPGPEQPPAAAPTEPAPPSGPAPKESGA